MAAERRDTCHMGTALRHDPVDNGDREGGTEPVAREIFRPLKDSTGVVIEMQVGRETSESWSISHFEYFER